MQACQWGRGMNTVPGKTDMPARPAGNAVFITGFTSDLRLSGEDIRRMARHPIRKGEESPVSQTRTLKTAYREKNIQWSSMTLMEDHDKTSEEKTPAEAGAEEIPFLPAVP